jgi:YHS domain-containing protein
VNTLLARSLLLTLGLLLGAPLLAAKDLLNLDRQGLALQGYDPVAYVVDGKAVPGNPALTASAGGGTYRFSTAAHQAAFNADPAKYLPAFGGYCAYGVSKNALVEVDPNAFEVVDGKLLLQYSKSILEKFNKDQAGNLAKAEGNWAGLVERKGK